MTERELSIALREMARVQQKPLCDEWYGEWADDTNVDSLLDKYVRGFDFVVENDYPPLTFIREHFDRETLRSHHIFVDTEEEIDDCASGIYVFLGNCRVRMNVDGIKAVTVYVRHESDVEVFASSGAKVFVTYYDKSHGKCESDGWSKCRRYDRTL